MAKDRRGKNGKGSGSTAGLHIERESAGYIEGKTKGERAERISLIWAYIQSEITHYRAPGHHPVSSPDLISSTILPKTRSELHIDHKPGRHILYLDTPDLDLNRARIQARVELKQKQKKGCLKEAFTEATIKIGDKADARIEEAVVINLDKWKKSGFVAALFVGIEAEVRRVRKRDGAQAGADKRIKFNKLKNALKEALKNVTDQKLDKLELYPLIHLNRDTIETEYSPCDHAETLLEVKTDECDWETVLRHVGEFAHIEIEHIGGNEEFFKRELDGLTARKEFGIQATNDSKEHPAMRALQVILIAQNDTEAERQRVKRNRSILENYLERSEFVSLDPKSIGINSKPVESPALRAA